MKYKNSKTRQNFLKKFLQRMVALVLMVLTPLQLMAADVIISTTDDPTPIGIQDTVDFFTSLDDPTLTLTPTSSTVEAYVSITWEIFISGTNQTVAAVGDVALGIIDIDGVGGDPDTREAISASLTGLSGYIVKNPTNLQVDVVPSLLRATGTESFKKLKIRSRRQENEFYS